MYATKQDVYILHGFKLKRHLSVYSGLWLLGWVSGSHVKSLIFCQPLFNLMTFSVQVRRGAVSLCVCVLISKIENEIGENALSNWNGIFKRDGQKIWLLNGYPFTRNSNKMKRVVDSKIEKKKSLNGTIQQNIWDCKM